MLLGQLKFPHFLWGLLNSKFEKQKNKGGFRILFLSCAGHWCEGSFYFLQFSSPSTLTYILIETSFIYLQTLSILQASIFCGQMRSTCTLQSRMSGIETQFDLAYLPRWLSGQESTCQCRRHRFNPWVGKVPWRRKWQPTPVFLPGKFHGQRSLVGYSPWCHNELNMTEYTRTLVSLFNLFYFRKEGIIIMPPQ